MLISLYVENFKSFKDGTTLSMLESNNVRKGSKLKDKGIIKMNKSLNLLQCAAIYGANASGKSTVIEVLNFMKFCVIKGVPSDASEFYFRGNGKDMKSFFVVKISKNEKMYEYGFEVNLFKRIIKKEWIKELTNDGKTEILFSRIWAKEGEENSRNFFDIKEAFFDANDLQKLNVYFEDFANVKQKLFITEMNDSKQIGKDSGLTIFKDIYSWFYEDLKILFTSNPVTSDPRVYLHEHGMKKVEDLIKMFDTGIKRIELCDLTYSELKEKVPRVGINIDDILQKLVENTSETGGKGLSTIRDDEGRYFFIEFDAESEETEFEKKLRIRTFAIYHQGIQDRFSMMEESEGTRRIFDMLELLLMDEGKVVLIDEIDRSLHPLLVSHFITQFQEMKKGYKNQLVFTTHQPAIMDGELFRKDEFWFVEKNQFGESTLYSLEQFRERNDISFSKAYIEGRYGGIPVLSEYIDEGSK